MIVEEEKFQGKAMSLSHTKTAIRLRFGNLPFIPIATNENCSLKRKYFCNNKTVSLLELEKAFLDCANEEDVFKLGFLNFAIFVLLGSEKHVHIGMRYLKFAEDLEEFVKYP
ncbi:unnamed protein product [Prunus armeniaca]